MKILQLTSHFSPNVGGVETHLDDLVKFLAGEKQKVFVLAYQPLTTKASWKVFEKKYQGFVSIFRIPWFPGLFYKLIHKPILEFLYLLPGLFFFTPFFILSFNPKVIHAHGLVAGFVGVFWGKVFGKKVIISTHSIYSFPKHGLYTSFVRWLFLQSDAILCLSKQSAEEIILLGIPEKKVTVFTYWIDLETFKKVPNAKEKIHMKNKFIVLFVGRLVKEKGIMELLSAAKKWHKNITLLIAGTGTLEETIVQAADDEHIVFLGKISQSDLPIYYSAADVLIVPSMHEEGFGRVLLESLACSTPVIAAKRGGITEAVDESVSYLIDISPDTIKKAVEYCYAHEVELKRKSKASRAFVQKRFSDANAEIILKTYE